MVRATATEVVKFMGGTYTANWDATSVGNICTIVDSVLDGKTYPNTLSTTATTVVALCNEIAYRYTLHGDWAHAGGALSGHLEPVIWTRDLEERLERLSTDATMKGFGTVRQQEET